MSKLIKNDVLTLDSREVAQMVGKRHDNLMRDIETYIEYLGQTSDLSCDDFFIESSYKTGTGKEYKKYDCTKKGCEFIAHKLTGQKGTLFTATYINKFHEMESTIKQQQTKINSLTKQHEVEAKLNNSKARKANILLKLADKAELTKEYKQVLYSYATSIIADKPLIPLPVAEEKTFSAGEIGSRLGISSNMVGRLANKYNLKTSQYGKLFHDKSKYSNKEVETFRYYENIIPLLKGLLESEV